MRIAPFVPRMVFTKNSSKPLVCAWVTMKKPTPKMMPVRLINIERRLAVRKRRAMRKLVDKGKAEVGCRKAGGRRELEPYRSPPAPDADELVLENLGPHPFTGAEFVLLFHDHGLAGIDAFQDF